MKSVIDAINSYSQPRNPAPTADHRNGIPTPTPITSNGASPASPARDRGDSIRDGFGQVRDMTTGQSIGNRPGGSPLPGALPLTHGKR